MNRDQARSVVAQTFTHTFDKARFRNFALNLLNHVDESKAQQWNTTYVKDAFKGHVNRYERLGTYTSPEREKLDVLIVYLTSDSKLERARTAIRNFVADHLKTRDEKDAALVAFVSPSETTWRFSFVKMEYAAVQADSGKVGIETRLTPARRFSYIVGEGESCHTAQTRFLELLSDTQEDPSLSRIEDAFSVEAVTKEFFTKYRLLFEEINTALDKLLSKDKALNAEFTKKQVKAVDFSKKLMGQIVFLYFLQKKGWLGVAKGRDWGTGPHDFLRKLARGDFGKYENFFNDILEPLFYDTLATDRGHEAWCDRLKCRMPFLNGGLFEPLGDYSWRRTDVHVPNELFTNTKPFEGDIIGTGVLDIFDRYNFTVNEAEPLEKEVAIDPEMLGKVFENLIEENRRKGMGAYYTPREIVHYMCQQCLINYLDAALNQGKENVPRDAIETFVRLGDQGALYEAARLSGTKSYALHLPKSIEAHARLIDETLAGIAICDPAVGSGAFPVGMMNEIVRARTALTPYFNEIHERTPYRFKHGAIQNCLYGVDIDPGAVEIAKLRLWLSLVVDEEETKQIKPLPNLDYKIVSGNSLIGFPYKSKGLHDVETLKRRFFEETDHDRKTELKREIDFKLRECFASSKKTLGYDVDFDFKVYFSEVFDAKGGFDVVIANPPYVDSERMTVEQPSQRAVYVQSFSTAKGNWDLFVVFIEQGMRQLNKAGIISYIVPNKLLGAPYAEALRELLRQRSVLEICDYSAVKVFKEVAVYPIVFRASMDKGARSDPTMTVMSDLEEVLQTRDIPVQTFYADVSWDRYFGAEPASAILTKIMAHPPLQQQCKGVSAAATVSEAYELKKVILEKKEVTGKQFKKFVNTGTIDRFALCWAERPTRYIKGSYNAPVVLDADLRSINLKRLQQAAAPKIIIGGMTKELECALDPSGEYLAGKSTTIVLDDDLENLRYLLGVLNSKIVTFWYRHYYKSLSLAGGYLRINQGEIKTIPVPKSTPAVRRKLAHIVDQILAAKRNQSTSSKLEAELEEELSKMYGLTAEEMALVQDHQSNLINA